MRLAFSAVCVVLAFTESCGYVGPVAPPSPQIPVPVANLTAVERGDQIQVSFSTPTLTTDFLSIKKFSAIELRAGPAGTPMDQGKWEAASKPYEPPAMPEINADEPQSVAMKMSIPVSDWQGQKIALSVRTAVRSGNHFSEWARPVHLEIIEPLLPPKIKVEPTRNGYKLAWSQGQPDLRYEIFRETRGQTTADSVGIVETNDFVDSTSQWDVPYTYYVVARKGTAESERSEGVSANEKDKFAPSVPQGVTALAGPDSVELTWARSPESDLKSYRIYRSVGNGAMEPLGDPVNLPTWSDRKVEHGKTYRYSISSIDTKNNESEKSAAVEVVF